jgi:hypothetical protein
MKSKYSSIFIFLLFVNILNLLSQNNVIIPKPNEISFRKKTFQIDENSVVFSDKKSYKTDILLEKYHQKIIGLGCQTCVEWIPTVVEIHFHVFLRIASHAEMSWIKKEVNDFDNFKLNLISLKKRGSEKGIFFATNAVVEKINMNIIG